jgi:hypothetical protein
MFRRRMGFPISERSRAFTAALLQRTGECADPLAAYFAARARIADPIELDLATHAVQVFTRSMEKHPDLRALAAFCTP